MEKSQYDIILLKRGPKVRLPQLNVGEVAFLTDIKKLAVGTEDGNYIIDECVAFVGQKTAPTFKEPQEPGSFYYQDVGPVRHFVFSEFKLYKKDKHRLEAVADNTVDMGAYVAPIGQTFIAIGEKVHLVALGVHGNKVFARSPKSIPESTLKTGEAITISGYYQVLM